MSVSLTPVNNGFADVRNQIAIITQGNGTALKEYGIANIDAPTRKAQTQFNRGPTLEELEKTTVQMIEMLSFDYFTLLDRLTIARSRRHVEKYCGTRNDRSRN